MFFNGNGGKRRDHNRFQTLPPEIISDILCRLPIEWILRCKSVCKTWYALLKDNYFVKLQLSRANDQPSRVILEPMENTIQHGVRELHLLDIEDRKSREIPGIPLADVDSRMGLNIMCFLDGFICVAPPKSLNPVVIYNPLIKGDYILLPKTEVDIFIGFHHIALGFDPSINKYKAVRMLTYSVDSYCYSMCEVITIGESSWRRVVSPYAGLLDPFCRGAVFHQGSIYWIIDKEFAKGESSSRSREFILEFDVTKEVFGVLSLPPSMRAPKYRLSMITFNLQLDVLAGGSLALMDYDGRLLHIWRVVKQNGTQLVGYSSIRMKLPYANARILSLLCPTSTEDFMLLQIDGGFKVRRRRKKEPQLFYYYSSASYNHRYVYLSIPRIPRLYMPWCFKPSLISIKAALLGHL